MARVLTDTARAKLLGALLDQEAAADGESADDPNAAMTTALPVEDPRDRRKDEQRMIKNSVGPEQRRVGGPAPMQAPVEPPPYEGEDGDEDVDDQIVQGPGNRSAQQEMVPVPRQVVDVVMAMMKQGSRNAVSKADYDE